MQPVKAVGIEVIADPVAAPALAAPGVGAVALSEGPAHPQVGGLSRQEWNHLVHHHLKVPFEVLRGALCSAHKDVGADATGETEQERRVRRDGEETRAGGGGWEGKGERPRDPYPRKIEKQRHADREQQTERDTQREKAERGRASKDTEERNGREPSTKRWRRNRERQTEEDRKRGRDRGRNGAGREDKRWEKPG